MNDPRPICDAYVAGVLDSEGCIYIARKGQSDVHSGRIVFSNTDEEVLREIHEYLGCGTFHKVHEARATASAVWQIICCEADSKAVLTRLMPWLRMKRQEAEIMLDFLDHKRLYQMGRGKNKVDREGRRRIWKSREFYTRSLQMLKSRFWLDRHRRTNCGWIGKPLDADFDASYHGWHASDAEPRLIPT